MIEVDSGFSGNPGEDINGKIVPYLECPHASDGPLWHIPHPGMDKNDEIAPYLAGKADSFLFRGPL